MRILFIILLILSVLSCCTTKRGYIKGKSGDYSYQVIKSHSLHQPVVCGEMYDLELKKRISKNGSVQIDHNIKCTTDINGKFSFKIEPGKYPFKIVAYPFAIFTLKDVSLSIGDTLKLNIYLKPNMEPIID